MDIELSKQPKNPTILLGFPGFGLVGTIASEFLNTHLETEKIGRITIREMTAMVAVHGKEMVDPISIYYNKKYNLLIVQSVVSPHHLEWKLAEHIDKLASELSAQEIICLEGVGSAKASKEPKTFFFSTGKAEKLRDIGLAPLEEGIIIGVTAALLSIRKENVSCIFAETSSELPDSKAAASLIKALDKYLGLDVDYKPLLMQAQQFEEKLRGMLQGSAQAQELSEKKWMNYVG